MVWSKGMGTNFCPISFSMDGMMSGVHPQPGLLRSKGSVIDTDQVMVEVAPMYALATSKGQWTPFTLLAAPMHKKIPATIPSPQLTAPRIAPAAATTATAPAGVLAIPVTASMALAPRRVMAKE